MKPSKIAVINEKLLATGSLTPDEWKHVRRCARSTRTRSVRTLLLLKSVESMSSASAELASMRERVELCEETAARLERMANEQIAGRG